MQIRAVCVVLIRMDLCEDFYPGIYSCLGFDNERGLVMNHRGGLITIGLQIQCFIVLRVRIEKIIRAARRRSRNRRTELHCARTMRYCSIVFGN